MTRRPRCAFWTVRFLVRLLEIANNELREINDTFVRCCDMGTVLQGISDGGYMDTLPKIEEARTAAPTERLASSVEEAAGLLGVNYFSVYRLIQRGKLKACRVLRGKLLVP